MLALLTLPRGRPRELWLRPADEVPEAFGIIIRPPAPPANLVDRSGDPRPRVAVGMA